MSEHGWEKDSFGWRGPDGEDIDIEDDGSITVNHDCDAGTYYGTFSASVTVPAEVLRDLLGLPGAPARRAAPPLKSSGV